LIEEHDEVVLVVDVCQARGEKDGDFILKFMCKIYGLNL